MACGQENFLERASHEGVVIVGAQQGDVVFGFTERTGGVSKVPYASLNLGTHVGDDPAAVAENRRRVLRAMGAEVWMNNLLVPNQVHGDNVVIVDSADPAVLEKIRAQIAEGADAIVCTAKHVPVMLCFADCVPVVLTCQNGFAVVHSGWRGTYARIAGKAALELSHAAGCSISDVKAYIGPHILGDEYEVSPDLMHTFALQFDSIKESERTTLDLARAIEQSLTEVGVPQCGIHDTRLSTMSLSERFYSYRREQGTCGRHAAVALIR
jgi:polyphenol oxidase